MAGETSPSVSASGTLQGFLEAAPDAIVVVDDGGRITVLNQIAERMFGYSREELLGRPVELLVPERSRGIHLHHRHAYVQEPKTRPMGAGRALTGARKDGLEFPIEISLSPLRTEQGLWIISIIRDITSHRQAEDLIKASLREKEVLLKEIHHRVKNNLQVTSSLLKLQSSYIEDPQVKELFQESQNRIRSMALVHEKLYQSSDLSRIDFPDYAQSLAGLLFRSFGVNPKRIHLRVEGVPCFFTIETAVPCGLIINELISNSLKHAFAPHGDGEIVIRIEQDEQQRITLTIQDNGRGLPQDVSLEQTKTLGLRLVQTLATQLRAEVELHRDAGTTFRFRFMELKP